MRGRDREIEGELGEGRRETQLKRFRERDR